MPTAGSASVASFGMQSGSGVPNNHSMASNNNGSSDQQNLVRPTEAQLRWAQFHHKRRAVQVRANIEAFLQRPATLEDVKSALPDDGDTSSSGGSDTIRQIRRRRPTISRGRRALLKVSRRNYERRREIVLEHGYQGMSLRVSSIGNYVRNSSGMGTNWSHDDDDDDEHIGREPRGRDHHEDALNEIFMVKSSKRKRRRRRVGRNRPGGNDESFKRFQAACHAMMMNLAAPPKQAIIIPTKIWTRTVDPAASLDDEYLDPKWGIRRGMGPNHHAAHVGDAYYAGAVEHNFAPMDRGASWMMHLPKAQHVARENPYYHDPSEMVIPPTADSEIGSESQYSLASTLALQAPGVKKFNQLVDLVQQRMIRKHQQEVELAKRKSMGGGGPTPTMKLRHDLRGNSDEYDTGGVYFADDQEQADSTDPHRRSHAERHSWLVGSPISKSPIPNRKSLVKERKSHYTPRMHLKEFMPEGTNKTEEAFLEEMAAKEGPGITKMRLREYSIGQAPPQDERRLSRARELAQSFEPKTSMSEQPLSKTRLMAQSIEGDPKSKHPKMKLRPSLDFEDDGTGMTGSYEEKKTGENSQFRRQHSLAGPFVQKETDGDLSAQSIQRPRRHEHSLSSAFGGSYAEGNHKDKIGEDEDGMLHDPPRQNSHDARGNSSIGSTGMAGLFSMLRTTKSADDDASTDQKQQHSGGGSQRFSDFFSRVRQMNVNTTKSTNGGEFNEEQDFFAQVREMISTNDDNEISATQRVSDFFAQVRQMSGEEINEQTKEVLLSEDCQVDELGELMESASVSASPVHSAVQRRLQQDASGPNMSDEQSREHTASGKALDGGRSSYHSFDARLNAISEKPVEVGISADEMNSNHPQRSSEDARSGGRVSGFLQMLQSKKEEGERDRVEIEEARRLEMRGALHATSASTEENPDYPDSPKAGKLDYNSDNDMEAMAAYRKSQESRRLSTTPDDTSSTSSFHALPDDIRQVVKKVGSSPMMSISEGANRFSSTPTNRGQHEEFDMENGLAGLAGLATGRPPRSPSRTSMNSSGIESLSPEKLRMAQGVLMEKSPLLQSLGQDIIDTDDTTSDASNQGIDPHFLSNLLLSPDLLQMRLHQAIRAVEERSWDDVKYLVNANPWLAEMCEVKTKQYLLHKLAFFGNTAPRGLCEQLIEMFPSAVHKFDEDGNVPLHLASAANHLKMIKMLGEKFESGASIRNEDGMLPLHFAIASCGDDDDENKEEGEDDVHISPVQVMRTVLKFFPKAVAIADNDGNLPIHVAAECLGGGLGVDIAYLLLDEADRQLQDPFGARFRNKIKLEDLVNDDISQATLPTDFDLDTSMDEDIHCSVVKNEFGETPLLCAVRSHKGWQMIEALVSGPGGREAAIFEDANKNNALHLLVDEFQDPAAAMSVLKTAPIAATMRNSEGMLPIESACLQLMPEEVILAIALVDLPFDIDSKDEAKPCREGFGDSWWYLACECDDHYSDIVQEIVLLCSFQQIRELCFMKRGSSNQMDTVLSRATPKCKDILTHALRFLGRFEFVGSTPVRADPDIGMKEFEALDFAYTYANEEGRRVLLRCFATIDPYKDATAILRETPLDSLYTEEVLAFGDGGDEGHEQSEDIQQQYCISIECSQLTLDRVVDGMVSKGGYQNDRQLRKKYAAKMCAVLRLIAKALRHLHSQGVIHGDVSMQTCGKFEHVWKLLGRMEVQKINLPMDPARFNTSFPPEALVVEEEDGAVYDSDNVAVSFASLLASPAIDVWGFGKLAYESLVGKPLIQFDDSKNPLEDTVSILEIMEWDDNNLKSVFSDLLDAGVTESCAEAVTSCLFPKPEDRPATMDEIIQDPFWKDMRQYRERSSPSKRSRDGSSSVFTESSPAKSIFTDTSSAVDESHEYEEAEV